MANETGTAQSPAIAQGRSVVRCRIESSSAWAGWTTGAPWREVRRAFTGAVAPLLDALQLPVSLQLEWHADRDVDLPGDKVCRLLVGDRTAVFVRLTEPVSADVPTVVAQLADGVLAARAGLVTPAVARRLQRAAARENGESDRADLARELVERGLRAQRAWAAASPLPDDAPDSHYDLAIDQDAIAVRVEVPALEALEAQAGDAEPLPKLFEMMSDGLFYELGILLPTVEVAANASLPASAIRVWINDMSLPPRIGLAAGEILVNDTPERLALVGVPGARAASNPANGNPCGIVAATKSNLEAVEKAGLTSWGPAGYVVLTLAAVIRRYAGALWSIDATRAVLFRLGEAFEPLVASADSRFGEVLLTRVLRALVDEEASLRNLRAILEAMLAADSVSTIDERYLIAFPSPAGNLAVSGRAESVEALGVDDWVTLIRIRLAKYLSHKYTRGQSSLIVYLLEPGIEKEVEAAAASRDHPLHTANGYLRLFRAIDAEVQTLPPTSAKPVILTTQGVRATLRRLIARDFPDLPVLCYQELSPEMNIQPIARISWLHEGIGIPPTRFDVKN